MTDYDRSRLEGVLVYPLKDEFQQGFDRYAVGVNRTTYEVYMIHTEGVSYQVHHDKPWRFNDMNYGAKWYGVYEVLGMADWDNPVDLTKWVRMHNDRLEGNLYIAYSLLTSIAPYVSNVSVKQYSETIGKQIYEGFMAEKGIQNDTLR